MQRNENPAQPHPSPPQKRAPAIALTRQRRTARQTPADDLLELAPVTDEPTSTWLHLSWGIELG
jgi:hypothetical protein